MRQGDRAQFEDFAQATSGELLRAAFLMCGDRFLAEDLVQDTLARVYGRWSKVRDAENPVAYARTILVRLFISTTRKRSSTERPTADIPDQACLDADVALRHTLVAALRQLSATDRAIVVQRYLVGLDCRSVARDLDLSEQAVRSRSSRALARVREILGPDFLITSRSGPHE
ncbi:MULTISPECIES: SigE family RNA polymerase sigma factor [unclassified Nocardioides]|uniref:SigE family RNA polymerase sigma factor n=1 Tax=unclassified Nocardioides TaxID=2615069 RepID=UPI0006F3BC5E|nr:MULTISPECIES: SigE family RNA polymerase sigma factor [unclassified Nocardioides]KQY56549.1 hypothetical protein ASD30_09460 [Nocardioides sp. Root140]KRF14383.1 hypothetical protein ASH02_08565 [Nocardioides sp. Soil796]